MSRIWWIIRFIARLIVTWMDVFKPMFEEEE